MAKQQTTIKPSLTPLETTWKGYRFRSRLEARWCVFFDSLGIDFEYEPEGYQLPNGKRYLPDFYLKHLDMYAEVKPDRWESPQMNHDFLLAQEFVMGGMAKKILFLFGCPDFRPYLIFRRIDLGDGSESWIDNVCLDIYLRPRWYFDEHRLYEGFADEDFTGEEQFSQRYAEAVYAARGERFEEKRSWPCVQ